MRIKNLRGFNEVRFKKQLDSSTLETSKLRLIRNFLRNGSLRVKVWKIFRKTENLFKYYLRFFVKIIDNLSVYGKKWEYIVFIYENILFGFKFLYV